MTPRKDRARDRAKPHKPAAPTAHAVAMGALLAQARKDAGFSQVEVAEKIGVHRNTVWRFEHGEPMMIDLFYRFCTAIDVPPGTMIMRMQKLLNE